MRVIHLTYSIPSPAFSDPDAWLKRISASIGVLESMTLYADVVGVYHISYKGVLTKNKVEYHFTNCNRWQVLFPVQFNAYVKKLNPDAIIVHGLIFPWQVIMLRWQVGARVKIIEQHHSDRPLKDIRQYFQRWADRYIKAYLFGSIDLGEQWVEKRQIRDTTKIKEIMGMSSTFYPMEKNEARSVTGVTGDRVFLWVGRLDDNKDPLIVIKAFSQLINRKRPTVKLYMIYQTYELLEELEELVKTTGVSEYVQLVGKIDYPDLQNWYNSADFIISSSHYEGGGIAVCEALSCGCIPILTDIPSFRMMTDNGRIGILYKAGNEESLLEAMCESLAFDRVEYKRKILAHFKNELSFDANARKIMQVIHEIE